MTILDEIIAQKRIEVAQRKENTPVSALEQMPEFQTDVPVNTGCRSGISLNGYHCGV